MCGQLGMIFAHRHRTKSELDHFRKIFTCLLLLSKERGPHATGVSWMERDGGYCILKRPQKAMDFIRDSVFRSFLSSINSNVTWLAGHTRWQTVGDASNNHNNHPILAEEIIGTHNGTVINADDLFRRLRLPRVAEVDSEVIFRMADSTLRDGRINLCTFKERLALCRGGIAAVMASKSNPKEVVIIKGNMPLEIRYNRVYGVVIYASDARCLDILLGGRRSWEPVNIGAMTIALFNCDCLETSRSETFSLASSVETNWF